MDTFTRRGRLAYPSADGEPIPSHVETAVIGGGMTGVLTALMLRMRGVNAVVFEAREIGMGGTGDCLGALGLGDGIPLGQIEASYGTTPAVEYARYMRATVDAYTALSAHYRLRAEVEHRPAVLYTQRWEGSIESEASVARRLGVPVEMKRRSELPFPIRLSMVYPKQGVLDPLMFLYGLARQVKLFAGVRVVQVEDRVCLTDEGDEVTANDIIYACRTPSQKMTEGFPTELLFCHSQALSLCGTSPVAGIYTGLDHDGVRLLWRGERTLIATSPTVVQRMGSLGERIRGYYPTAHIEEVWTPWDAVTADGLPMIGRISPHGYIATGYGGRGLSYAMIAAELLTAEIMGEAHPLSTIFSPSRTFSRIAMQKTMARLT